MALSGTLETFSLPDVLRLLSSTKKTGLLALDGDRGRGRIWVRDGAIVGAEADRAQHERIEGVAFELLRFVDAGFEFHSGAEPSLDGAPRDVDDVLAEAEGRLAEWREIEAVVPSLDVWVRMVAELDGERPVTPAQWRVLAQIGTGASGHALAERLEQGEYDICRQLRDLVDERLVELDAAPAEPIAAPVVGVEAPTTWDAPVEAPVAEEPTEPTFVEPALDPEAVTSLGADLASFVAVGTVEEPVVIEHRFDDVVDAVLADEPEQPDELEPVDEDAHDADDADDGDLLSELSQLSPRAAAAVEATWGEPAASAADPVDQNLLLRFLSSTKQ